MRSCGASNRGVHVMVSVRRGVEGDPCARRVWAARVAPLVTAAIGTLVTITITCTVAAATVTATAVAATVATATAVAEAATAASGGRVDELLQVRADGLVRACQDVGQVADGLHRIRAADEGVGVACLTSSSGASYEMS